MAIATDKTLVICSENVLFVATEYVSLFSIALIPIAVVKLMLIVLLLIFGDVVIAEHYQPIRPKIIQTPASILIDEIVYNVLLVIEVALAIITPEIW